MFPPLRQGLVLFLRACFTALALTFFGPPSMAAAAELEAEARSILSANCLKCHGPAKQKGGLRFDSREGTLGKGDSGAAAVAPGRPAASELIRRVSAEDATLRMPPEGAALTAAQVET